jgi:peroxiredoxin
MAPVTDPDPAGATDPWTAPTTMNASMTVAPEVGRRTRAAGGMPMPGQPAPAFHLPSGRHEELGLAQLRGAPVVLVFYPADFSPVCADQMTLYQAVEPEFSRLRATVLGVSVDGVWCHRAFAEQRGIGYPLLSDFEPKGAVCREYGVYDPDEGVAQRALFVLDDAGAVAWNYVSESGVNPGADGILTALEQLDAKREGTAR